MNASQEPSWTSEEQLDNMGVQDIDFSNLLDLGDIDVSNFTLPDSDGAATAPSYANEHSRTPFSAAMSGMQTNVVAHDFAHTNWDIAMDMDVGLGLGAPTDGQDGLHGFQHTTQQTWDNAAQQPTPQGSGHIGNIVYRQPHHMPPTPNSWELHGQDPARLDHMIRQRQAFIDQQIPQQYQFHQAKPNDLTPLVSPAATPLDTSFQHHPAYAVPGAYFSPLTSPALLAQNGGPQWAHNHATAPGTAHTSAATSPNPQELDIDMYSADNMALPQRARKPTKKAPTQRSITQRPSVRQSPVTKAQKRKSTALNMTLSNQDLDGLLHTPQAQQTQGGLPAHASSTDSSGQGSISPEPLSEALMGPPPRPGTSSNMQSPSLLAQAQQFQKQHARSKLGAAPATPASLMSIDSPRNANGKTGSGRTLPLSDLDALGLEDLALPPAVTNNINVPLPPALGSASTTPRLIPSRRTPRMGPIGVATAGRMSVTTSPALSAVASPRIVTTPIFGKDSKSRLGKKRGSVSTGSAMVSPAIRPKISPSIKPLLPDGSNLSDSQHAYLLASKSNYTHLLEGTLLPGVSYPDSLSSGLTTKRTSHKIAEQGRRNRINEALKEMQSLLPQPTPRAKSDTSPTSGAADEGLSPDCTDDARPTNRPKDKDKTSQAKESPSAAADAKAANSKASTVESAIDYIRALQHERVLLAEAMKAKDSEVQELREKLRHAECKLEVPAVNGAGTAASTCVDMSESSLDSS